MGKRTSISWAHHTFSPWWGCLEVSPACTFCYARTFAKRVGHAVWGKNAPRRFFGEKHWQEPLRWDRAAAAVGERRRVFCASMCDIGEVRHDDVGAAMDLARTRLWETIRATPHLDWMLLTKRPALYGHAVRRRVPDDIRAMPSVWPGVTVEGPAQEWRASELSLIDCAGPRWISHEPALGRLDLDGLFAGAWLAMLIIGGESSHGFRQMDIEAARATIRDCRRLGVACWVKQDSSLRPGTRGRFTEAEFATRQLPRYLTTEVTR